MAIDDNTSYELYGSQIKDLVTNIKARAFDSDVIGATSSVSGARGLVPTPVAGDQNKFLAGDGTWKTVSTGSTPEIEMFIDLNSLGVITDARGIWSLKNEDAYSWSFDFSYNHNQVTVQDVYGLYLQSGKVRLAIKDTRGYKVDTTEDVTMENSGSDYTIRVNFRARLWSDRTSDYIDETAYNEELDGPFIGISLRLQGNSSSITNATMNKFAISPLNIYMNKFDAMNWQSWYANMGGPMYQDTYVSLEAANQQQSYCSSLFDNSVFQNILAESIKAGVPINFYFVLDGQSVTGNYTPACHSAITSITDTGDAMFEQQSAVPTFEVHHNGGSYNRCIMKFSNSGWSGNFMS